MGGVCSSPGRRNLLIRPKGPKSVKIQPPSPEPPLIMSIHLVWSAAGSRAFFIKTCLSEYLSWYLLLRGLGLKINANVRHITSQSVVNMQLVGIVLNAWYWNWELVNLLASPPVFTWPPLTCQIDACIFVSILWLSLRQGKMLHQMLNHFISKHGSFGPHSMSDFIDHT